MKIRRREFLGALALGPFLAAPRSSDITVSDVRFAYQDFVYRAPYQFGGRVVDKITLLDVKVRVTTRNGKSAWGFGSMPLGNLWAFPAKSLTPEATLDAMKALATRVARIAGDSRESGHPLDLAYVLEPAYLKAAIEVGRELGLRESIPKLCTLVVASPFDAAIHDGFGKVHGRNVYSTYDPNLLSNDLSKFLGDDFRGVWLDRTILGRPQGRVPLFHSVGGLDPLEPRDVQQPIGDGLPETLAEWIPYSGIVRIKMKLSGEKVTTDVRRALDIDRVTAAAQAARGVNDWSYCLDFNERCPDVEYVLECLRLIRDGSAAGFRRILYVEQPTARDLRANRYNVMHEAAKLRPVVIDESLTGLDTLLLAREMGYNGVALNACKGQSQTMLMAAAAARYKMFVCVQDLTCPGASLIQSLGIAARVSGVAGLEANARQYVPAANAPWTSHFPGVFDVRDGYIRTDQINGPGLGIPDELTPAIG